MERRRCLILLLAVAFLVMFTAGGVAQEGPKETVTRFAPLPAATKATLNVLNELNRGIRKLTSEVNRLAGTKPSELIREEGVVLHNKISELQDFLPKVMATFPKVLGVSMASWTAKLQLFKSQLDQAKNYATKDGSEDWSLAVSTLVDARSSVATLQVGIKSSVGGTGAYQAAENLSKKLTLMQLICIPPEEGKIDAEAVKKATEAAKTAFDSFVSELPNVWNVSMKDWCKHYDKVLLALISAAAHIDAGDVNGAVRKLTEAELAKGAIKKAVLRVE